MLQQDLHDAVIMSLYKKKMKNQTAPNTEA